MAIFEGSESVQVGRAAAIALWLLVAFLAATTISTLDGLRYIGTGVAATNTIQVSGHGEELAVPDIATFTFTVSSTKASVADAQTAASSAINAVTAYLTSQGVASADIQTRGYSVNPQYEYQNAVCPQPAQVTNGGVSSTVYCPGSRQVLTGYEVDQTTTVKVRDTSKAGTLLAGVGSKGATNVSGLQFTFDNPDAVQASARDKAIADAKSKADALAKSLGVSLVRVVSFNENAGGNGGPVPMYALASGATTASVAPQISTGQNDVTDDVTITYEIK